MKIRYILFWFKEQFYSCEPIAIVGRKFANPTHGYFDNIFFAQTTRYQLFTDISSTITAQLTVALFTASSTICCTRHTDTKVIFLGDTSNLIEIDQLSMVTQLVCINLEKEVNRSTYARTVIAHIEQISIPSLLIGG